MIRLDGWRVLVTGGGRGIGAACCRLFARAGAAVWVHYRSDEASADAVRAELESLSAEPHRVSAAEISEPSSVRGLLSAVDETWGRLDCVVNNAGIWVRNPIDELDVDRLQETLRVNVDGPFLVAREALPLLRRSRNASIVNITSTAGQRGEAFYSPYGASKGAIIAATKGWSTELAPDVRVNSVAPGWVDTEMCVEPFADGGRQAIEAGIPLGRVASPEDIAGPVLFLASPLARHITGEIVNVNGGSVLCG